MMSIRHRASLACVLTLLVSGTRPAFAADSPADSILAMRPDGTGRGQRLYPVVDEGRRLLGLLTRNELAELAKQPLGGPDMRKLSDVARSRMTVAHPDESLRVVVYRMAESGLTRFPVVDAGTGELRGLISLPDLLKARALNLEAEQRRERLSPLHLFFPRRARAPMPERLTG